MADDSFGNAFQGNVSVGIDPPQVQLATDTDKQARALAPKHPHWRNDPTQRKRLNGYTYQGDIHDRLDDLNNIGAAHTEIGPA